jgi:hypothetical protein
MEMAVLGKQSQQIGATPPKLQPAKRGGREKKFAPRAAMTNGRTNV